MAHLAEPAWKAHLLGIQLLRRGPRPSRQLKGPEARSELNTSSSRLTDNQSTGDIDMIQIARNSSKRAFLM